MFANTFSASVYLSNVFLSYANKYAVSVQIEQHGFLAIQTHFSPKSFYSSFQFAINDHVPHHVQNAGKVSGPEFTITNLVPSHGFITTGVSSQCQVVSILAILSALFLITCF